MIHQRSFGKPALNGCYLIPNRTFSTSVLNDRFWPKAAVRRQFCPMTGNDPKQTFVPNAANVRLLIVKWTLLPMPRNFRF